MSLRRFLLQVPLLAAVAAAAVPALAAHQAEISRRSPLLIVKVRDVSQSMNGSFGGLVQTKAEGAAQVTNSLLEDLGIKASKGEEIRDYFHVAVIDYTTDAHGNAKIASAFTSPELQNEVIQPISRVAAHPAAMTEVTRQVDDGTGRLVPQKEESPVWVEPKAEHGTPMAEALEHVHGLISAWAAQHPDSFPPIVIHTGDGEATGAHPGAAAEKIKSVTTNDGNALLFMAHVSETPGAAVLFPNNRNALTDPHAQEIFDMSSELPAGMIAAAKTAGIQVGEGARAMLFNGDKVALIKLIDIGTRPAANSNLK